jgi:chaperonin cofactor prefoldin
MNYYDKFSLSFLKDNANSLVRSIEYIEQAENEIANAKEDDKSIEYSIGSVRQRISPERAIQMLNENISKHERQILDFLTYFKEFEEEYGKIRDKRVHERIYASTQPNKHKSIN